MNPKSISDLAWSRSYESDDILDCGIENINYTQE